MEAKDGNRIVKGVHIICWGVEVVTSLAWKWKWKWPDGVHGLGDVVLLQGFWPRTLDCRGIRRWQISWSCKGISIRSEYRRVWKDADNMDDHQLDRSTQTLFQFYKVT